MKRKLRIDNKWEYMLIEEYSEFICGRCHGVGFITIHRRHRICRGVCPKCKGIGKLDWIEHITGERYETKTKNR